MNWIEDCFVLRDELLNEEIFFLIMVDIVIYFFILKKFMSLVVHEKYLVGRSLKGLLIFIKNLVIDIFSMVKIKKFYS